MKWWEVKHRIKYWDYRPKWIIQRWRERALTLKRGYATYVLDEFDHHFNEMAVNSLKYHLSPECVVNNEAQRPVYEDLIARLSESPPRMCDNDAERQLMSQLDFPLDEHITDGHRALFDRFRAREDEWCARRDKARHDFVDIMPGLWS